MRKTTKQIEQLILQALLSDVGVYNINEICRRTGLQHSTVKRRIKGVFERIKKNYYRGNVYSLDPWSTVNFSTCKIGNLLTTKEKL